MTEIVAVLGLPLAGALILAFVGHRGIASAINMTASFLTFAASMALTARVICRIAPPRRGAARHGDLAADRASARAGRRWYGACSGDEPT